MSLPRPDIADGTNLDDKPVSFQAKYLVDYITNFDKHFMNGSINIGEYVQIALTLKMLASLKNIEALMEKVVMKQ